MERAAFAARLAKMSTRMVCRQLLNNEPLTLLLVCLGVFALTSVDSVPSRLIATAIAIPLAVPWDMRRACVRTHRSTVWSWFDQRVQQVSGGCGFGMHMLPLCTVQGYSSIATCADISLSLAVMYQVNTSSIYSPLRKRPSPQQEEGVHFGSSGFDSTTSNAHSSTCGVDSICSSPAGYDAAPPSASGGVADDAWVKRVATATPADAEAIIAAVLAQVTGAAVTC